MCFVFSLHRKTQERKNECAYAKFNVKKYSIKKDSPVNHNDQIPKHTDYISGGFK